MAGAIYLENVRSPRWMTQTQSQTRAEARPPRADASLERRACEGDPHALEALLRQHARAIFAVCRHVAGPADGQDATQEALARIVSSIRRYAPEKGSFRGWALTVARNVCRDRRRRRGLERRTFVDNGDDATALAQSPAPGPERMAIARADSERLSQALSELPEPMRLAVVLYHVHGSSYEEVASTLEVPNGTVMTWLHRGRKRLRAALAAADRRADGQAEEKAG